MQKVEKRDNDASLMELKREFMKYESLRRQHDTQIIQIGLESGIRMTPEKWSQTLYGDSAHKSEMQSIIDKLQSMNTIERLIEDFYEKLEMYSLDGLSLALVKARDDFDYIAGINFEKKQQQTTANNRSGGGGVGDDDTATTNDTSVDSSRPSEEEPSDELDMLSEKEGSSKLTSEQQQQPQVRIIWTLLLECLKCTLSILHAHVEFSSKIMSLIINNQNMMASAQSSVANLPIINSNKNNNLGGGNNNMMGSYNNNNNNNNSKQWSSLSMRQGNHHQQSPIQPPNNRSFYNNNNTTNNNNNSRMPYANKFENHPPHHMQQLRDVHLIGMGPNWRQQQASTGGYRNTSSSSSASSYRSRNTPDSGFSSPYTPGKPSVNSYQGGPLQYRQFGGGMPGANNNNNNNDGLDPSDLLYMPPQSSQSTVRIPFNSSGV